ncbi:MAG: tetratricopeptide repeat protein [Nitrospira sp.]
MARALTSIGKPKDLQKAQAICEQVRKTDPANEAAESCLGVIYYKTGRWRESEECFLRAIELNPVEGPYRDLGALYAKQGSAEEALQNLTRAIEIDKLDTRA